MVMTVQSNSASQVDFGSGVWPDWTPTGELIYSWFTVPGKPWDGKGLRIFASGSDRQLIPEATAPVNPDYSDRQPVWSR